MQVAGTEQAYTENGWADRFALPFATRAHGYGMSADDVGKTDISDPQLLVEYHADVHARTAAFLPTHTTLVERIYPGLGHGISADEIEDVREFLATRLA